MMKLKNIDCYADDIDIDEIKKKYNITVIDFGTPIEVKPDGKNFKLNNTYGPQTVGEFTRCDIKLVLGFTDDWNIEKLNFFFLNDTWHNQFDNSYLFIVPSDCDMESCKLCSERELKVIKVYTRRSQAEGIHEICSSLPAIRICSFYRLQILSTECC